MRSNKLVAITVGTALLGATGLVGVAAGATRAAPGTRPVPAPATETIAAASVGSASAAPDAAGAEVPGAEAVGAAAHGASRTPESALAEVRVLIRDGVPGASPELDARLKEALRTADQAVTTLRAHTSAREMTRSWVHAMRPGNVPESVELPGVSALEKVYGEGKAASGTVSIPAVPAGSQAAEGTTAAPGSASPGAPVPDSASGSASASATPAAEPEAVAPDLGPLLDAVTGLDLADTLDALADLLGGVLSTLTTTVFTITGSLAELT